MANAMLEDEFRSSHEDLMKIHSNALAPPPRLSNHFKPESPRKVEFVNLPPPPPKRSKTTIKAVVQAISDSITATERRAALEKALESFDHPIQAVHDEELQAGADVALVKVLILLNHVDAPTDEVAKVLQALEAVYRASSPAVGTSFDRMGGILLKVLVDILDSDLRRRHKIESPSRSDPSAGSAEDEGAVKEYIDCKMDSGKSDSDETDDNENSMSQASPTNSCDEQPLDVTQALQESCGITCSTPEQDTVLQKVTTTLGHLARVGQATKPIAHHPGLLGSLVHVAGGEKDVPWEARLTALWIIANLACHDENMPMMVCTPNLLACLVNVACRPLVAEDSLEKTMDVLRSRLLSSRAILNLSWSASNKILLAEHLPIVDMLCELAVHRTSHLKASRTVQDCLQSTRRHAVGALRNLAAAPRRTKRSLAQHRQGRLLGILTDAALNDTDNDVKNRAFAAIQNLATHDTAELMVQHPALVLALKGALLGDQGQVAKKHASATLLVLERTITPESMEADYRTLQDLLDAVQPSPTSSPPPIDINNELGTSPFAKGGDVGARGMAAV